MAKSNKKKLSVNRNRKKSWRKFTDIDDVEEHLDTKRLDEIVGGPISEKPDESLFFVDKIAEQEQASKHTGRVHWSQKQLRCFQILKSDSKVEPLRKHVEKTKKTAVNRFQRKTKTEVEKSEKESGGTTGFDFDLWGGAKGEDTEREQFLDEGMRDFYDRQIRKKGRKVPEHHFLKKSLLPAVEVPLPGASYNPTYDDHQELLSVAHKAELDKIKEERRLRRALDSFFPAAAEAPNDKSWMLEMSQGIFEEDRGGDEEIIADGPLSVNPPVRADKRKSANRRRREQRLKILSREEKRKKLETIRATDIYRIRSFKADIVADEKKSKLRQERKLEKERKMMYQPRCLSRYKYEAADVEVNLSSELTGCLRTAKADGHLLVDRFKSLQRRNVIEARIKQRKKKKGKFVRYERKNASERM